jgi:hypothetical protein
MVMAVRSSATVTAADTAEIGTTAAVGERLGGFGPPFFYRNVFFLGLPNRFEQVRSAAAWNIVRHSGPTNASRILPAEESAGVRRYGPKADLIANDGLHEAGRTICAIWDCDRSGVTNVD